jgi:hypothetical protein
VIVSINKEIKGKEENVEVKVGDSKVASVENCFNSIDKGYSHMENDHTEKLFLTGASVEIFLAQRVKQADI